MQELNVLNNLNDSIEINTNSIDMDKLEFFNNQIKSQYETFDNLGIDYFKIWETDSELLSSIINITDYKLIIFQEMLEFINNNYFDIDNYENVIISSIECLKIGQIIYEFISCDLINVIIPNYLLKINCDNLETFDTYFNQYMGGNSDRFKASIISNINDTIKQLLKLEKLDNSVIYDENYKLLLQKYNYYTELINFGDSVSFVENIFRPIILKYEDEVRLRLL